MGNITTRSGLALALLLAACTGEVPPPQPLAGTAPHGAAAERGPIPATGAVHAPAPEAAPLAETRLPDQPAPPRELRVALGANAAHTFDAEAESAFATACAPLDISFTRCRDREACELLMTGRADLAIVAGPLSQHELQAGLRQTELGIELWALVVPPASPVHSLTRTQVRQILTGQVTTWPQLGYEGGTILPVAPADARAADRAEHVLIPGDHFASHTVRVATERHVADQLLQNAGAIGITRITEQPMEAGLKTVQIDWCPPTVDAFAWGTYTCGTAVHLVTAGQPAGEARRFLEFARGTAGRTLLGRSLLRR